jgi:hypothetical protein
MTGSQSECTFNFSKMTSTILGSHQQCGVLVAHILTNISHARFLKFTHPVRYA